MSITYTLEVYGYIWSGGRSVYSYDVKEPVTDDSSAKRAAGDFESLIDWRCVKCSTTYVKAHGLLRRCDEWKTLRGFRSGKMTPRRFYRIANGY